MNKKEILDEIRRLAKANGGVAPGLKRFETETGVRYKEWYGRFWSRWSDAVREAGCEPNRMTAAYDGRFLLEQLVILTRRLGRVPVEGDILLAARNEPMFPTAKTFLSLGLKPERVSRVIAFCEANPGHNDVAALWREISAAEKPADVEDIDDAPTAFGYVYLLKHGTRREYKIGRTKNPLRREGEVGIQLPEKLQPIHYIKTDDPAGIENYWHSRFAAKRKEGEWFLLTAQDVRSFKRWKRIY